MRNYVQNPSAEGSTIALDSAASAGATIVADAVTGPGANAYQMTPTNQGTAALKLLNGQRPAAAAGDRWWALFRARWVAGFGSRTLSCYLRFQDSAGNALRTTQQDVTLTAPGTFRRWTGTADASTSEEYTGTSRRVNLTTSPRTGATSAAYSGSETLTNVSGITPTPSGNTTGVRVAFTTAGGGVKWSAQGAPSGAVVLVSAYVLLETAAAPSAFAAVINGVTGGPGVTLVQGQWVRVSAVLTNTSANTATSFGVRGSAASSSGSLLVSDMQAEIVPAGAVASAYPYFDGNTTTPLQGTYHGWSGAAGSSPSIETAPDGSMRVNYAHQPLATNANIPSGTLGWSPQWYGSGGGAGTTTYVANAADGPAGVSAYSRKTWTAVGTAAQDVGWRNANQGLNAYPVGGGLTYAISSYVRASRSQTSTANNRIYVTWVDASGATISNASGTQIGAPLAGGVWTRYADVFTAPANAAYMFLFTYVTLDPTTLTVGDTLDGTALLVERVSSIGPYFDGYTIDRAMVLPTGRVDTVQQFAVTDVAPTGTAYATLLFVRQPGPNAVITAPTSGDLFNVDALMLTQSASTVAPKYADPSTDGSWFWSGAANASQSYSTAPDAAPVVAVADYGNPSRVELRFQDLPAGVGAVNVYALTDGRQYLVRGGIGKFATGGAALVDYEPPLQTPVTYRAEMFATQALAIASANGQQATSLGFTGATTTTVNDSRCWVQQPLDPSTAFAPIVLLGTAETISRQTPGDVTWTEGSELATWIGSQRQGLTDLPVKMLLSMAQLAQLDAALGGYGTPSQVPVLLIRTPPPMPVPRLFYGTVPKTEVQVLGAPRVGQEVQVSFTSDEARPVAPGLVKTQLRRADLDAAYATRGAMDRAYLTRLAMDSDYDLAGLAG